VVALSVVCEGRALISLAGRTPSGLTKQSIENIQVSLRDLQAHLARAWKVTTEEQRGQIWVVSTGLNE
jgi:hypothetical protein